ncbi:hypothetical protein [Salinibacterium sp. TMP30]|uniref:hypothetical protein n=1 Tax=Salinibacterium sp. TMP30 TaxID=3138237 RepID=UPI003139C8B8
MANSRNEIFDLETISTTISNHAHAGIRSDRLAARALDLAMFGGMGYELVSTLKVEGEGSIAILDTLQRRKSD